MVGGNDSSVERLAANQAAWILETTVLSAFAVGNHLDILAARYGDNAMWTTAVHAEIVAGIGNQPRLGDILVADWLGEPQAEFDVVAVENLRLRLGGRPADQRHLGEATSLVLAGRMGAALAVDDRDAKRAAENAGVSTVTTISILKAAIRDGQIAANEAAAMLHDLVDRHNRRLPRLSIEELSA